jgi:hypothetical protein
MKRLVLAGLVLTASLVGQDVQHAPTVAQCQADQRLWLSKIEDTDNASALPTFDVLSKWQREMSDCKTVDPSEELKYYNTGAEIRTMQGIRLMNFIARHGLWDKFKEEDAAGKRE